MAPKIKYSSVAKIIIPKYIGKPDGSKKLNCTNGIIGTDAMMIKRPHGSLIKTPSGLLHKR